MLYNECCLQTMSRMPDAYLDLTVTSPPYDGLRKYNGFSFPFEDVAASLYRVTAMGGVVVWIVADATVKGSETGTSFKQALHFMSLGFNLYDTMIWRKPSPQAPTESRYYDVFEYMFVFSKGKPKTLNLITDRVNKCFGTIRNKESRSNREDRKLLTGIRTVPEFSRRFNVWDVSRGSNMTDHPAVFPVQLAEDHILSWSNVEDLIYDPFAGSGTVPVACIKHGRRWIASETSGQYVNEIALPRINKTIVDVFFR